jgi:hypothetical protein
LDAEDEGEGDREEPAQTVAGDRGACRGLLPPGSAALPGLRLGDEEAHVDREDQGDRAYEVQRAPLAVVQVAGPCAEQERRADGEQRADREAHLHQRAALAAVPGRPALGDQGGSGRPARADAESGQDAEQADFDDRVGRGYQSGEDRVDDDRVGQHTHPPDPVGEESGGDAAHDQPERRRRGDEAGLGLRDAEHRGEGRDRQREQEDVEVLEGERHQRSGQRVPAACVHLPVPGAGDAGLGGVDCGVLCLCRHGPLR